VLIRHCGFLLARDRSFIVQEIPLTDVAANFFDPDILGNKCCFVQ